MFGINTFSKVITSDFSEHQACWTRAEGEGMLEKEGKETKKVVTIVSSLLIMIDVILIGYYSHFGPFRFNGPL